MLCKILLICSIISGALSSELIVQLMEWRFEDIARECDFLSTAGFTAVQVSPVSENLILPGRPWYERYQIMSYKINTRSGDADAFKKMTEQCAKKGIRVYVDVIFNHMTANQPQPAKGTGGSLADPPSKSYPGVPYNATHFHPTCDIGSDYMNATRVRVCELVSLHDLDQKQEYVREILIRHLNELIDLGATGFRIDAAKHMYPEDLELILNRTKPVPKYGKPFVYQEVPNDSGPEAIHPSDYFGVGSVTEFKFGTTLRRNMDDLTKWQYLTPGTNIDLMRSDRALVFTDNHDRQRDFPFFSYKNPEHYKLANAFLLSWPYGEAKKVMSSFDFSSKEDGPPHNSDDSIKEVTINSNKQCGNGWVCEHRWPEIAAMVQFAKVVKGTDVSKVQASATTMSYQRTGKGFVVLSMNASVHGTFQTGLPKGQYCEIVSGAIAGKTCGGAIVDVNKDGNANLEFPVKANSSLIVALHVEATKGSSTVKFSDIVLLLTSIFTTHLSG